MSKAQRSVAAVLGTLIAVGSMIYYIITHSEDFNALQDLSLSTTGFSILLASITIISGYLFNRVAMQELGVTLDLTEWIGIPAVSNVIGLFVPMRADLLVKGIYYKKKCGLSYSKYISITAGSLFIMLCIYTLELIACLAIWGMKEEGSLLLVGTAGCIFIALISFVLIMRYRRDWLLKNIPLKRYTHPVLEGFYALICSKKCVKVCLISIFLSNICGIMRLLLISEAVGIQAYFFQALLYYVIYQISGLFSLLPGNIGITEALFGVAAMATGDMFENGMILSLLVRVTGIITYMLIAAVFLPAVMRKLKK